LSNSSAIRISARSTGNGASVSLTSTIGIRVNMIIDRYMEIVRDQVGQDGRRQFVSPQAS
jgi:hypothetical protein